MHYILSNKPFKKDIDLIIHGSIFNQKGEFVPNIFNSGISLSGEHYSIRIDTMLSKKGKSRDKLWVKVNGASNLFVLSQKACAFFEQHVKTGIEIIDLTIFGSDLVVSDYKLINFTKKIDCADDDNSEIIYIGDTDQIYSIEYLALVELNIPTDTLIFQLARTDHMVIVVKEKLKELIENSELTGFEFIEPSKFSVG